MPMALTLTLVLIYIVAIVLAFWLIKRIIKVVIANAGVQGPRGCDVQRQG